VGIVCTRVVYLGPGDRIVTGRSMDWKLETGTNLWLLPRGAKRTGQAGPDSAAWTSKYGSVVATGYDICTTDGVNEADLAANLLWLAESEYPPNIGDRPAVALSLGAQYMLDNFASVARPSPR
jgi:penicillin V acylase-like amidase (Ntn superfamily)